MKNLLFMTLTIMLLISTSCQSQEEESKNNGPVQGQSTVDKSDASPNQIADHLAQLSTQVPDVQHATALVIGPYAVVGIDVNGDIDQSKVGAVKYQVVEALASDPYGASAAVTADPDILDRIEQLKDEMGQGRPLGAIMNELAAIIGRIMPVIPGEEHRQREDPTNINNDKMPEGEQENLEDIQDDQSKGRMEEGEENKDTNN